ncbi:MFS transporter [Blastococcus sp. Marseille-P5729]|uniref:MFS transporter n=1 Tax=Blastococcus sp. Marseille-P5729 TaxID=2086582 RepID=UPI000D114DE4|nr:MFS transporter [Blastococcus sp. Marseille-P5729]
MTGEPASEVQRPPAPTSRRSLIAAVVVLCVTQLVGWGVLFYAMPVALEVMSADTGWSRSALSGAFTAGLIVSAFVGVPMGWLVERRGPRMLMTLGSLLTLPPILLISRAESLTELTIGWMLCGIAMPALFYQVSFAACAAWLGKDRVKGITAVTLVGGVSSTVFAPLTSALLEAYGWRTTWVILGILLVVVLVPLQWFFLTPPWTPVRKETTGIGVGPIVRSGRFIALSASVTTFTLCGFAVTLTIVSLMTERGFSHGFGAVALGVVGLGQLLGRLGFGRFSAPAIRSIRNIVIVATMVTSTMLLVAITGPMWAVVVIAVLFGAARGAGTLMHATAVVEVWGPERYGALVGVFGMPITLAQALSPWIGASLAGALGSFAAMDLAMAIAAAIAGIGIYLTTRARPGDRLEVYPSSA